MKRILLFALLALTALVAVLIARALTLESKQLKAPAAPKLTIDSAAAVQRFAKAIQFRTVSSEPQTFERDAFIAWLAQAYPRVHASLKREITEHGALLYTWSGSDPARPALLLMGHYDTVPVEANTKWTQPPFSGAITGGFIWGRGTLDDKLTVIALLEAAELLLAENHTPKRTILFAFGHDEEIGGQNGAAVIARLLQARGVKLDAVIDEGGIITLDMQGTDKPVALVGIAEKGMATVELLSRGSGGHSSMPPPRTEVGAIAAAVDRVQGEPFEAGVHGASAAMFRWIAPEVAFSNRVVLANLWLLEPALTAQAAKSNSINAVLRTTTAPTVISGGVKDNVIPSEARALVNFRILPGESVKSVVQHVKDAVGDERVQVRLVDAWEPSPVSDPEAPQFRAVQRTIAQTFPEALVAPFLVVGATDARYFRGLTPNVYRFSPIPLAGKDLARVHGIDERVSVDSYLDAIRFYRTLILNMQE
jgi:carboxypeptidase PM20D1